MEENILKMSLAEIFSFLGSSESGLTQDESKKRLRKYGLNVIKKNKISGLNVFFRQFKSSLIYLLLGAFAVSFFIKDYSDGIIILIILFINTLLGFWQEYKAEKTIEKISQLISSKTRVQREGHIVLLDHSEIVPGDIVIVKEGDIVPADIRLFEAENLQINESQLTGESVPVNKKILSNGKAGPEEFIFAGSIVEKGIGKGIVYKTGQETQIGSIASLAVSIKKKTQYEKYLLSFGASLVKIVLIALALVFVIKLIFAGGFSNIPKLLLFIIATAVAVVPEALPVIATVSLARESLKLAKKHVVVKRLSSIEDLGNINILCTDKTGTITENKMAIKKIVSDNQDLFLTLIYSAIYNNELDSSENYYDQAFLNYIHRNTAAKSKHFKIVKEIPFDPEDRRRRMVVFDLDRKKYYLVVIGAPEIVLQESTKNSQKDYLKEIQEEGGEGFHHLALAYKEVEYLDSFDIMKNEKDIIFLGYASFEDPLRPTAKNAMLHAEKLGIKIKLITGDGKEISQYVGKETGLLKEGEKIYVGEELEKMSPEEFKKAVLESNVFARVSPKEKYRIIKVLQEVNDNQENVVAYQGDGINDALALKLADVSIAVNSATDIAKESSDIVVLNKSLEVIVNGIKQGRSIFVNIQKYIKYTMVSNFGNFIALSILYLTSSRLPMLPVQVLLTSMIVDIPLIGLSFDNVEVEELIKPKTHNIKELITIPLMLGVPTALFELFYYFTVKNQPEKIIQTGLFLFFSLTLIVFYSVRTKKIFFKAKLPPIELNILFFLGFLFSIAIIYIPVFQKWFSFAPLGFASLLEILALIIIYFFCLDSIKVLYYRKRYEK